MYIESSSRNVNDTAKLISPVYELPDTELCFEFFYHMFGATIGSLRVYLKKESQSWDLNTQTEFFSKEGNQGDKWYRAFRQLGVINEEFQIIIEGIRGSGYISDIAIDDVRVIANCTGDVETTTMPIPTNLDVIYEATQVPIVDSCENRCGETEERMDNYLACDCNDGCFESNRCCPDFFDFCFSGKYVQLSYI